MDGIGVAGREPDPCLDPAEPARAGTSASEIAAPGGATSIQRPPNCGADVAALLEPELLDVELERPVLVCDGDADVHDAGDGCLVVHVVLLMSRSQLSLKFQSALERAETLSPIGLHPFRLPGIGESPVLERRPCSSPRPWPGR